MDERAVRFALQSLRRTARNEQRLCYAPGCQNTAIWSHILQKNGLLSQLARNGKLVELREDDLFRARAANESKHGYYFEERRIASAFTFLGFCSKHDRDIFAEIETQEPDFGSPRTPLLFSYRAFLNELQKQENNLKWYSKLFADSMLSAHLPRREVEKYRNNEKAMRVNVSFGKYRLKPAFDLALKLADDAPPNSTSRFRFWTETVDRLPVCVSSVFSVGFPPLSDAYIYALHDLDPGCDLEMHFVNVIPYPANKTTIVIGYWGADPSSPRAEWLTPAGVSTLLLRHVETWAVSPDWYEQCLKPHESRVLWEIRRLLPATAKMFDPVINIFALQG